MKRLNGYPDGFFYLLLAAMFACSLSGIAMYPWVMEFKLEWELDFNLPGSLRLGIVSTHTLAASVLLMLLGALWQVHIRAGWRRRENHFSGIFMALALLLLMLTGIGLYYLSSSDSQLVASVLHSLLGLGLSLSFVWHWVRGHQIRAGHLRAAQAKHGRRAAKPGLSPAAPNEPVSD